MNAPRLFVLILFLTAGFMRVLSAQDVAAPAAEQAASGEEDNKQVRIYRTTLLEGRDAQTRVDAATLLLFSDIPEGRRELIRVLRDQANPEARAAVCRALVLARENRRPVANKAEFIEPLLDVLKTESDPDRADLAAQALLMFTYDEIQKDLEGFFVNPGVSKTAQLNAIRTLKYEPDERAIFKLIGLLESPDEDLAAESRTALETLGLEVPGDPNGIRALTEALQRRGPETFLTNPMIMRNWLLSRRERIGELRATVTAWEERYITALRRLYAFQADEQAKGEFLAQQLSSREPSVKLWALGQLEELQKGTGKLKFSEQLESTLLSLVSDRDRRVRLSTANLLNIMWELNSTKQLLDQLQVETDAEVRLGLFRTLGTVCYYASLPTSAVKVPGEVRKRALELAVNFLNQSDPARARSGAEVIRRLLEQDGLPLEDVNRYLKALADRYQRIDPTGNQGLRGELLGAMAGLCAQRSVYRAEAAKLYRPVFEQALDDESDGVRQSAVDGLISIDRAMALRRLRTAFTEDRNPTIRARLVDLAGDVGGTEDLDWLSKQIGQGSENDPAWQAMLRVFRRSDWAVVNRWMARFGAADSEIRLSNERKAAFLAVAEQAAQAQDKSEALRDVWARLFRVYVVGADPQRASEYMDRLLAGAGGGPDNVAVAAGLLDYCLSLVPAHLEMAGAVIEKVLSEKDLEPDSSITRSIGTYLSDPPEGGDPNGLLARLREIEVVEPDRHDSWRRLLAQWESYATGKEAEEVETVSN